MLNAKATIFAFAMTIVCFGAVAEIQSPDEPMNQEAYVPPQMPDYPTSYEEVMATLAPYYQAQRPLDYFFELYVIDTLELLPAKTHSALEVFSKKHPSFFESAGGNWREFVTQQLHLSNTVEIAIWDLWLTNSERAKQDGWVYHPWHYAINFQENYTAEGSKVDVWEGNSLELAKERIQQHRASR